MLIDGEKYACDACVRGHRVSNCQHADRHLNHINKKGRPVSQCQHCRGLRKARASHVKCECGERERERERAHGKGECGQADKGDGKGEGASECKTPARVGEDVDLAATDNHACCCTHGARCSCALKRDHLDPVPEIELPGSIKTERLQGKPRLSATQSDSTLTVFANGHHKPVHRNNHSAQDRGVPYKIPRPHSIHGPSALTQRSMESLPSNTPADGRYYQLLDSFKRAQQDERLVRSEHGSPGLRPALRFDNVDEQLPQLDLAYQAFNTSNTASPIADSSANWYSCGYETFTTTPDEQPSLSAAPVGPPVDWSTYFLQPQDGPAYLYDYSQAPSYASFENSHVGRPELTASSSGEISEVEDLLSYAISNPGHSEPIRYAQSVPDQSRACTYRPSADSSWLGVPRMPRIDNADLGRVDIDAFLQASNAPCADFGGDPGMGTQDGSGALGRHGFTVEDAQKLAHPVADPGEDQQGLALRAWQAKLRSPWATGVLLNNGTSFSSPMDQPSVNAWTS